MEIAMEIIQILEIFKKSNRAPPASPAPPASSALWENVADSLSTDSSGNEMNSGNA